MKILRLSLIFLALAGFLFCWVGGIDIIVQQYGDATMFKSKMEIKNDYEVGTIYVINKRVGPQWNWKGSLIRINSISNGVVFADVVHVRKDPYKFKDAITDRLDLELLIPQYAEAVKWMTGKTPDELFEMKYSDE